ncbi:MAG TPA: hypothetical protein VNJ49_08945 [Bradyrhizobium sp.]|nr:hypothetical protein [Bradyrhizobium sp.]
MRRVEITGTDRRWNEVAAVEDNGKWRMFLPFPLQKIHAAALVGSDRLVCLSENGEICLIDWRSDKEIARRNILQRRGACILVTADAELIVLCSGRHYLDLSPLPRVDFIQVLRATTLETIAEGNALQWSIGQSVGRMVKLTHQSIPGGPGEPIILQIQGRVVEDYAGRLAFVCHDCGPFDSRYGLCRIDRSDWSVHFEPIPSDAGPWMCFGPGGRYAVARHLGGLSAQDSTAGQEASDRAAVAKRLQRNRGMLELWTTEPPRLKRIIVTQNTLPPEDIYNVVWEPAETGFWVKFGNSRRIDFQRVGIDGSLSPVFSFQRFRDKKYPFPQDIVGVADRQHVEVKVYSDSAYIQRDWCKSELPFRLISEDEDGFCKATKSYANVSAVRRFLAPSDRRHALVVQEFSETAIVDTLRSLTRDVREHLADMVHKKVLELSFEVDNRTMTETAFFARLTRERIPVASELRDLLTAYLEAQPRVVEAKRIFRQIWGPEEEDQGAFAPAMQALLHLDPSAHDVFRDYLAKRDGEHEAYSTNVIMKNYVQETGWRDRAMISFGVYFALIRHRDGRMALAGGLLDEYGLLQAAERMFKADEFASLIMEEIDQFIVNPGLDVGTKEDLYEALQPSLEMTRYGQKVLAVIASRSGLVLMRNAEERGSSPAFLRFLRLRRLFERKQ